jgi:hypothetical protein
MPDDTFCDIDEHLSAARTALSEFIEDGYTKYKAKPESWRTSPAGQAVNLWLDGLETQLIYIDKAKEKILQKPE